MSKVDILCKFLKQVGPNKQVRWRKKAVNLKLVGHDVSIETSMSISGIPEVSA